MVLFAQGNLCDRPDLRSATKKNNQRLIFHLALNSILIRCICLHKDRHEASLYKSVHYIGFFQSVQFFAQSRHPATFRIFILIPHGHNCSSPYNVLYAWFSVSRFLRSLFIQPLKFLSSPIPPPYSLSSHAHIPPNQFLASFIIFFHHHIHFWKTM